MLPSLGPKPHQSVTYSHNPAPIEAHIIPIGLVWEIWKEMWLRSAGFRVFGVTERCFKASVETNPGLLFLGSSC